MDERDQELLEKQLRAIYPAPRSDGVLIMAVAAVFAAGITVGGLLVEYKTVPTRMALNDATFVASAHSNAAHAITWPPVTLRQ